MSLYSLIESKQEDEQGARGRQHDANNNSHYMLLFHAADTHTCYSAF